MVKNKHSRDGQVEQIAQWVLFVDSRSNESTKHNIKEFLISSFICEMTDTYDSLRLSKFSV